ncbi:MAG: hypothetical protein AB8H80_08100 [Planctomycetota bacterium]
MMSPLKKISVLTITALLLAGCGEHDLHEHGGDGDAGHANQKGEGMADEHGERHELGKGTAFGVTFDIVQFGEFEADHEPAVELIFASGKERITTARGWVGLESGVGSMKNSWHTEGETNIHGHIEVPDPMPAGSKLWVELQKGDKTETVSVDFHK